jgi:glycosyltransferase involved in cell wall biosynthesis
MRAVALLATYNEERFIAGCLEHLLRHGLAVYLVDNGSTDATVEIASRYHGRGLIEIESFPRSGQYSWRPLLQRKEELAATLDADWFMHLDADEIRLPARAGLTLAGALERVDREGYNAVNFLEFVFTPTREDPDHDHADYERTMRWYYLFAPPAFPHRLNAWKRQPGRVDLASSGGHQIRFDGVRRYPESFPMRHYLFLSADHARRKYVDRRYDAHEVAAGWHRARAGLTADRITLPSQRELKPYISDDGMDTSQPRKTHHLFSGGWPSESQNET